MATRVSRQRAFVAGVAADVTTWAGNIREEADRRYRQQVGLARQQRDAQYRFAEHVCGYGDEVRDRADREDYRDITLADVRRRVAGQQHAQPVQRLRVLQGETG